MGKKDKTQQEDTNVEAKLKVDKKIKKSKKKESKKTVQFNLNNNEQFEIESRSQAKETKLTLDDDSTEQQSSHGQRSWSQKLKTEDRHTGRFTDAEVQTLKTALCKYVFEKQLGQRGLLKLVSEKSSSETLGAWSEISSCLPLRSVQSCHNFCRRRFNPNNYGGKWSEEETAELIALVKEHGRKWKKIGEILERTDINVRDKYRHIGEEKSEKRSKFWTVEELTKLVKTISKATGVKLLKYRKTMREEIKTRGEELNESSIRQGSSHQRIRNTANIDANLKFLISYIDYEGLNQLSKLSIPWTDIAEKMSTKSKDDCKNKWTQQILKIALELEGNFEADEEEDLIMQIAKQEPDSNSDIDFEIIDNGKSVLQNKAKWNALKKRVTSRTNVTVPSMLSTLVSQFKSSKQISSVDQALANNADELVSFYKTNYGSSKA